MAQIASHFARLYFTHFPQDNITSTKNKEAKYNGVDLKDVISRIVHFCPKKYVGLTLPKFGGPFSTITDLQSKQIRAKHVKYSKKSDLVGIRK